MLVSKPWLMSGRRGAPYVPPAPPSLILDFTTGVMPPGVTFTRTSVATYFDANGVIQTAAANAPRFDYDPVALTLRGLLIEEARTNLLLNSASLGTQTVTVTAVANTLSFYGTGTVVLSGAATGTLVGTGAFPNRAVLTFTPTAGSLTLTVTGTVQNANLTTGAFATSWIPTTSAAVARTVDTAQYPAAPFDPNTGTLAAEFYLPQVQGGSANVEVAGMDQGTTTDIMILRQGGGTPSGTAVVFVANANVGAFNASPVAVGINGVALTYRRGSPNAVTVAANGGAVVSGAPASLPTPTRLTLGVARNSVLSGHIRRITYWPRVLSPNELSSNTLPVPVTRGFGQGPFGAGAFGV